MKRNTPRNNTEGVARETRLQRREGRGKRVRDCADRGRVICFVHRRNNSELNNQGVVLICCDRCFRRNLEQNFEKNYSFGRCEVIKNETVFFVSDAIFFII